MTLVVHGDFRGGFRNQRIGVVSECDNHSVTGDVVLTSLDFDRLSASRCVRFTKLVAQCTDSGNTAVFRASEDFDRILKESELDSLFLRVVNLFLTGRHFSAGAAVNDIHLFRSKTECHAGRIHSNVSTTADNHCLCLVERSVSLSLFVSLHQVCAGKIFICTENTYVILTRDSEEFGETCTGSNECRIKALFGKNLLNG